MKHLRGLMESVPFTQMRPARRLVLFPPADDRDLCPALRGKGHALIYIPSGQPVIVRLRQLDAARAKATWYDPRTGRRAEIGDYAVVNDESFDPPGWPREGNDWVLALEQIE